MNQEKYADEWERLHDTLGCQGCRYEDGIAKGPCCEAPFRIETDAAGKCLSRKEG